jgi:hypothetical protein
MASRTDPIARPVRYGNAYEAGHQVG